MENKYTDLLRLSIEIEGLLSLLEQGHSASPERVESLLKQKIALLASKMGIDNVSAAEQKCSDRTDENDEAIAESATMEQIEDADPFDADDDSEETEFVVAASEKTARIDINDEESISKNELPNEKSSVSVDKTTVVEPVPAPKQTTPVMKLDEKLAIDSSRDIRRAFTLNDRFRFRRELFENSEARFVDALEVISAMTSFEEAEEYFYDDLCWDPDSDHVKEFMQKVNNHFHK